MIVKQVSPRRLARPESTQPLRISWYYLVGVTAVHLLALLAFLPWCFLWQGLPVCLVSLYVFNTLGINLCYHRLLTHRGLTVPRWLERGLALLGVCCLQDSPVRWVAIHRMHHQHSDEEDDPHSPLVNFVWAHFGWLFIASRTHERIFCYERYARDLLRDPFYFRLERQLRWLWVYMLHAALIFGLGFVAGCWIGGTVLAGLRWGSVAVVWGVFVRTVVGWHITWSVNSVAHVWGYKTYETRDESRNNWFVALISNGEGWHNNHHFDQRCAVHGHRWWELDITWLTIRALERLGLATDVVRPKPWDSCSILNRPAASDSSV